MRFVLNSSSSSSRSRRDVCTHDDRRTMTIVIVHSSRDSREHAGCHQSALTGGTDRSGACCDNKTMRFETGTAADLVLSWLNRSIELLVYRSRSRAVGAHNPPEERPSAPPRTRAPELPHSSAGGARGARRHRPHVPTSPYDNVHMSHAHTKHWIPVRSTLHPYLDPYCTLVACACTCGSPTQTREHGRWDLSVLPRAAPARPQRPTGTIQHTERRGCHTRTQ